MSEALYPPMLKIVFFCGLLLCSLFSFRRGNFVLGLALAAVGGVGAYGGFVSVFGGAT